MKVYTQRAAVIDEYWVGARHFVRSEKTAGLYGRKHECPTDNIAIRRRYVFPFFTEFLILVRLRVDQKVAIPSWYKIYDFASIALGGALRAH